MSALNFYDRDGRIRTTITTVSMGNGWRGDCYCTVFLDKMTAIFDGNEDWQKSEEMPLSEALTKRRPYCSNLHTDQLQRIFDRINNNFRLLGSDKNVVEINVEDAHYFSEKWFVSKDKVKSIRHLYHRNEIFVDAHSEEDEECAEVKIARLILDGKIRLPLVAEHFLPLKD